jgi:hypothetical protein
MVTTATPVLKTGVRASVPWVRIPPSPPFFLSSTLIFKDSGDLVLKIPMSLPTFWLVLERDFATIPGVCENRDRERRQTEGARRLRNHSMPGSQKLVDCRSACRRMDIGIADYCGQPPIGFRRQ